MQKIIQLYIPTLTNGELDKINSNFLSDGWKVKNITNVDKTLILLLEKETRKEKLDELDSIAKQ